MGELYDIAQKVAPVPWDAPRQRDADPAPEDEPPGWLDSEEYQVSEYLEGEPASNGAHGEESELDESWRRVDLGPVLRGEVVRVEPCILARDDGRALFYPGRVNGIHGDSGDGKSWAAEIACAQEIQAGHHVIWIDFEDPDGTTIVDRLRVLGVEDDEIETFLHYHKPIEPFDDLAMAHILDEIAEYGVALVVIDSVGEAFGLEGVDEDRDAEVGPWLRRVARPLADAGPAVLLIDHSTKAKDNALYPSGSKRKRAAITGASYLLEAPAPLTKEKGGRLRLTCAKDRYGNWRRGEAVAEVVFTPYPDGGTSVHVWEPTLSESATPEGALLVVARAVVKVCRESDRPLTGREIRERMKVKASHERKLAGIDAALGVGAIRAEYGSHRSVVHHFVHDIDGEGF